MNKTKYFYFGIKLVFCIAFTIIIFHSVGQYISLTEQTYAVQQMSLHAAEAYKRIESAHLLGARMRVAVPALWVIAWLPDIVLWVKR